MIDTLRRSLTKASDSRILEELGLPPLGFALLTLHRPSNVDENGTLARILAAVAVIQQEMPVVFPVHPRTRASLLDQRLAPQLRDMPELRLVKPLGYLDFLKLMDSAAIVLTDSGGIQEETTVLGVPCLTLRANTERPVTIELGSNRLVGADPRRIIEGYEEAKSNGRDRNAACPPLWDGHAAERICDVLCARWAKLHCA
jgi:UDP-N-acetylglucosamine 2-epimerase (non-hydrolysing)